MLLCLHSVAKLQIFYRLHYVGVTVAAQGVNYYGQSKIIYSRVYLFALRHTSSENEPLKRQVGGTVPPTINTSTKHFSLEKCMCIKKCGVDVFH